METINVDKKTEIWEWTCPRGHRTWEPTNFSFWCPVCARSPEADPTFECVRSARDGRELDRGEIKLVDRRGNTVTPPRRVA